MHVNRTVLAGLVAIVAVLAIPATSGATTYQAWGSLEENDCLYAAAAAWEATELRLHPTEAQVFSAYWDGDQESNVQALNHVWSRDGIDGVRARIVPVHTPPRRAAEPAYIVGLEAERLPASAQWPTFYRYTPKPGERHAVLMVARSTSGVYVVSWGQEWKLTWAEWNRMRPEYFAVHRVGG